MQSSSSREIIIDKPKELGFSRVRIRDQDVYEEEIVDAQGIEVVQPQSNLLVMDIFGSLALVQLERKFLFVPLDSGFVDLNGNAITEQIYDEVRYYDPMVKWLRARSKDRIGFSDEYAKLIVPLVYEYAEDFSQGKARVHLDGRSFYIAPDGIQVPQ